MSAIAPLHDVILSRSSPSISAIDIGNHLASKGFCVVDPSLDADTWQQAQKEAEAFGIDERLQVPPAMIAEGLLGSEGSSQILSLGGLSSSEAPGLMKVDATLTEMAGTIAETLPLLGFKCPQRSLGMLHVTGMPADQLPDLEDHEGATWLSTFSRARIMILAIVGPIKGTLELNPLIEDTEPLEVPTIPHSLIFLRADLMSHKHFAHSSSYILSCFLLQTQPTGPKEERAQSSIMSPWAQDLEAWTIQRLQELKEEEAATGTQSDLPEGWRSAMDRMFHVEQRCAVRGVAGRFCGSWSLAPWHMGQVACTDLVTEVPLKRWDHDTYYDADPEGWRAGKTYLKHGSFAEGLELFDCRFFGLSPMESSGMDPHQRQVLEVGYEACHRAGYVKKKLMSCVAGVYLGSTGTVFGMVSEVSGATGGAASINSNRFSFCLGMKGPSMTVDTDSSSSLTAVHLGADAVLQKGRGVLNTFSLAGGVYWNLGSIWWPQMQGAGLLSRTGRCLTWDTSADGHCFGDGCGFVVQKRLTDTVDGERVYIEGEPLEGVIASSNLNSNGLSAAMHAPHGPSEQELIAETVRCANISGSSVDGVECDGRGGFTADAVEADSVARVLKRGVHSCEASPLILTSMKSHMGNGYEAAGICSLLRVLVSNRNGIAIPNCHLYQINPYIEPQHENLHTSEVIAFPLDSIYYGITSRGFGGTNVHVLTFGQPDRDRDAPEPERWHGELGYWPGGGGELEDEQVPLRGYYVVGSWSGWKPEAMQSEGGGSYGFTVTLGENVWEDFQILIDNDTKRCLHPGQMSAPKNSLVVGPEANVKGTNWRIDGRPRPASAVASIEDVGATEQSPSLGPMAGDKYRVHLRIAGKYRMVTWDRLADTAGPGDVPVGAYFLSSDWNGWRFDEMTLQGSTWQLEVTLLRGSGEFQIVRNQDLNQVICPASPHSDATAKGVGPDDGFSRRGFNWRIEGSPGDVFAVSLTREAIASWAISWERLRTEDLSQEQRAQASRLRLGVSGSWSGFTLQHEIDSHGFDGERFRYSFFVQIGPDGREGFQLLADLDWARLIHPDRHAEGSGFPHRVFESFNDGSAMDMAWVIGQPDEAAPGQHFKVEVLAAGSRVFKVSWVRASGPELDQAVSEGRILKAA